MDRILLPAAAFALLALVGPWPRAQEPDEAEPLPAERELASLIPAGCPVFVDASGALPLFEQGPEHPFLKVILESPLGAALRERMPGSVEALLAVADGWLGGSSLQALADVTARGLGLAYDAASRKTVVVALGRDAQAVARATELLFRALERQFGFPGAFQRPHERWSGAEVWLLGKEAVLARRGELFVLGNGSELVQRTLALAATPDGAGLRADPRFRDASAERGEATLWAWLDVAALGEHEAGLRELRAAPLKPPVQGLLGERIGALLGAEAVTLGLTLDGARGVRVQVRGLGAQRVAALAPEARGGLAPAPTEPAGVGEALLYRDYARFVSERATLFPPEFQGAFAEAITNGALFFEGQDLGADVLPHLSPWLRVVSRALAFDPARRPEIPLPGVAVVAVLDDARDGEPWVAAFQSLVAIVNVDRAQKGGRALRLALERAGEVEISLARYATPAPEDGVDLRYNLEPAIAIVGRHLVLGSHVALVRELVTELAGVEPLPLADATEFLALDAEGVRAAVRANLSVLVARKVLAEGLAREAAERELDGVLALLASLEGLRLETSGPPAAPRLDAWLSLAASESPR